jgi:hypothetical protein
VKFTIRQRNDAGIFVKVSKMTITIYQNITVKFNDEEYTYSECWTYNTTKSVVDEFHMPEHLFENVLNFRYQTLAECWFELGSPDPSYKQGSLLEDGADPKTPWGRAKGRWDLREVPENASPIRKDRPWKILWDDSGGSHFHAMDMVNFCLNHIHGTVVTQKIEDDSTEEEDALSVMSTAEQNCVDKQSELNAAGGL